MSRSHKKKRKLIYDDKLGWTYADAVMGDYTQGELDQIRPLTLEELHQYAINMGRPYKSVLMMANRYRKQMGDPLPILKRRD